MSALTEFHFLRPYWLLALLPLALTAILMMRHKLSQGSWISVCDEALLPYLLQKQVIKQSRWPFISGCICAFLLILALAGPAWDRLPTPAFRNDAGLIIVLDLSRSMDASDVKPSRLAMARFKIADILKQRKDGQTALIAYAGDAFVVTPLTNDSETIVNQLPALTTEIMPVEGSNTATALEKAVSLFKQAGLNKGHILLITDGVDVDNVLSAIKSLDNYQLSVLGVGTPEGAPIALTNGGFLKDSQGNMIVPKLDQAALENIARAGQGSYQTLSANDVNLNAILASLDEPEQQKKGQDNNPNIEIWNDRGPWLILLALPLAAFSFRKGILCFLLLLILPIPKNSYALTWQDLWLTKDQQAANAYQNQHYAEAAQTFENKAWQAAAHYKAGQYDKALKLFQGGQRSDDFYNKGNSLAQDGRLEEALKAYQKALELNPKNADAQYNLDVVKQELQKQREQKKQQGQQNKQEQQGGQQSSQSGEQNQNQSDNKNDPSKENQPEQNQQNNDSKDAPADHNQKDSQDGQAENQQNQSSDSQGEGQNKDQSSGDSKNQQQSQEQSQPDAQQAKDEAAKLAAQKKQDDTASAKQNGKAYYMTEEQLQTQEQQQANEQFLKRVPDDPSGLLRRKFKYQYGQRDNANSDRVTTW